MKNIPKQAYTAEYKEHWLEIKPSCSRPRVSDDNAFAETLFRTAKYRPEFPATVSPISTVPASGQPRSCTGPTMTIGMAASVM